MSQTSWVVASARVGCLKVDLVGDGGGGVDLNGEGITTAFGDAAAALGEGIGWAGLLGGLTMVCPNPACETADYVGHV